MKIIWLRKADGGEDQYIDSERYRTLVSNYAQSIMGKLRDAGYNLRWAGEIEVDDFLTEAAKEASARLYFEFGSVGSFIGHALEELETGRVDMLISAIERLLWVAEEFKRIHQEWLEALEEERKAVREYVEQHGKPPEKAYRTMRDHLVVGLNLLTFLYLDIQDFVAHLLDFLREKNRDEASRLWFSLERVRSIRVTPPWEKPWSPPGAERKARR